MTESAIKELIHLAQSWGPIGFSIFVLFLMVFWTFWQNRVQKTKIYSPLNDVKSEIDKLRGFKGAILQEIGELKVELEKRVTYSWIEKKVVDKLDDLNKEVSTLTVHLKSEEKSIENRLDIMEKSLTSISEAMIGTVNQPGILARLGKMEETVTLLCKRDDK